MLVKDLIKTKDNWKVISSGLNVMTSKNQAYIAPEKKDKILDSEVLTTLDGLSELTIVIK